MKNLLFNIVCFSLVSIVTFGQEFDASAYVVSVKGDDDNEIKISADGSNTELNLYDYNGHPFIQMTHSSLDPVIELYRGGADYKMELTHERISVLGRIGPALDEYYSIDPISGFIAYDNNQNITVQIHRNVNGDGRVTTNELEITGGSDLSENFHVVSKADDLIPGMLVSISSKAGELEITQSAMDKKVVGIISGANGIETGMTMGQRGSIADGDYPVALTGRTYVLATCENGPIKPGDFITSSNTPGYGMKVKNVKKTQGAIIGKAMTSLDAEAGYVLVLVNLQ